VTSRLASSPAPYSRIAATCRPGGILLRRCSGGRPTPLELETSIETVGPTPSNPTMIRGLGGLIPSSGLAVQEWPHG
jgi:hypothetical protein